MSRFFIIAPLVLLIACTSNDQPVQVGDNTFIYREIVYRIIDNQITELGTLKSDTITKSAVLKPILKSYGNHDMDYVRNGVYTTLTAVYRGDLLYFKMELFGLNDLREAYRAGHFTLSFVDDYGFRIYSIPMETGEMTRMLGANNETLNFEYNGKAQMSSEMHRAIFSYTVSAAISKKNAYGY